MPESTDRIPASRDSVGKLFDRFEDLRKDMLSFFDKMEDRFDDLQGKIHDVRMEVGEVKTDVALIKQNQEQDRAQNAIEHGQICERLDKVEETVERHKAILNQLNGAGKLAHIIWAAVFGLILSALSGGGVYLLMR